MNIIKRIGFREVCISMYMIFALHNALAEQKPEEIIQQNFTGNDQKEILAVPNFFESLTQLQHKGYFSLIKASLITYLLLKMPFWAAQAKEDLLVERFIIFQRAEKG